MMKPLFLAVAFIAVFTGFASEPLPEKWTEKMTAEWDRIEVKIKSSADGSDQPAYFHLPPPSSVVRAAEVTK